MNRDDIIRMAQKAHLVMYDYDHPSLERFAALVAAAEREACASMAEAFHHHQYDFTGNLELHEAIRARGQE
jgi:metal-responsive CopG/Arc/MetJ family transcriptional regulator